MSTSNIEENYQNCTEENEAFWEEPDPSENIEKEMLEPGNTSLTVKENANIMEAEAPKIPMTIEGVKNQVEFLKSFQEILRENLKVGEDIEIISDSAMLTKAGSSKVQFLTNSWVEFSTINSQQNYETGFFEYKMKAQVRFKNSQNIVAEGIGSDSTYDTKVYYQNVEEKDLLPYYQQFIDYQKYIVPLLEAEEKIYKENEKWTKGKEMNERRQKYFDAKMNRKYKDKITGDELELEDLEKRVYENKNYTKTVYKVPNKEVNLSGYNHKCQEMACKRAEAFAFRRLFNLDKILKEITAEHKAKQAEEKKNKANNGNSGGNTSGVCQGCGKPVTGDWKYCFTCNQARRANNG